VVDNFLDHHLLLPLLLLYRWVRLHADAKEEGGATGCGGG
jgi:hypothetical protein